MILYRPEDRRSSLERLTHDGVRRRPRHGIESQTPRCPICEKEIIVYIGRFGPKYRCGCPDRGTTERGARKAECGAKDAMNGNGTNGH